MIEERKTNDNKKVFKKKGGKRAQNNDETAHQTELQKGAQKIWRKSYVKANKKNNWRAHKRKMEKIQKRTPKIMEERKNKWWKNTKEEWWLKSTQSVNKMAHKKIMKWYTKEYRIMIEHGTTKN